MTRRGVKMKYTVNTYNIDIDKIIDNERMLVIEGENISDVERILVEMWDGFCCADVYDESGVLQAAVDF